MVIEALLAIVPVLADAVYAVDQLPDTVSASAVAATVSAVAVAPKITLLMVTEMAPADCVVAEPVAPAPAETKLITSPALGWTRWTTRALDGVDEENDTVMVPEEIALVTAQVHTPRVIPALTAPGS